MKPTISPAPASSPSANSFQQTFHFPGKEIGVHSARRTLIVFIELKYLYPIYLHMYHDSSDRMRAQPQLCRNASSPSRIIIFFE